MSRRKTLRAMAGLLAVCFCLAAAGEDRAARLSPVAAEASSFEEEAFSPDKAIDGDPQTRWSSRRADREWITIDLGENKAVGKIVLNWETACAEMYQVQVSQDGETWYVVDVETAGAPGEKEVRLQPVSIRYIRMYGLKRKTDWGYSLYALDAYPAANAPLPLDQCYKKTAEYKYNPNDLQPRAFFVASADMAPKGHYPIWVGNEQGYWTITGTERGFDESLICEDGMIEPYYRSWSVMPYLRVGGRLVTAQDVELSQSLEEDYLPIPSVRWDYAGLVLDQKMFTWGEKDAEVTYVVYHLENTGADARNGRLYLTFRPFQVTPSWQGDGGMVDIFSLRLDHDAANNNILVNEENLWHCVTRPDAAGAVTYLEGEIIDYLVKGALPPHQAVLDPWGGATGALQYDFNLAPGEAVEYVFAAPLGAKADVAGLTTEGARGELAKARAFWEKKLNRVTIDVPDRRLVDVLRSNLAYLFINRDGPVLQPGPRHYGRSWIRDASLMGMALLRTGYADDVREYIDWIADRQLFNGDVPCMINADGSMWHWGKTWPEYDGQGAFVTLVGEYYRFTGDKAFLADKFPNVIKALQFVEYLRNKRLTEEFKDATDERARFYGLLPLSVSHEGYALPGKHSYWDDFWALKGWREAIEMARALGRDDVIPWMEGQEKDLRTCLLRSIKLTQEAFDADYIPGCADLGEFDACSPAITVWPTEEYKTLPRDQVLRTFDKYYDEVLSPRLKGDIDAEGGYVPYEMKLGGVFFILGDKQRGLDVVRHFLTVTRPLHWNQWGEVVYYDPRKPGYIGDMPHSWAGADYINTVLAMFLYEDEGQLVLGAGVDEAWLDRDEGVSIAGFPTAYGPVGYTVKRDGNRVTISVNGSAAAPPKGFLFRSPLAAPIRNVSVNGKSWDGFTDSGVTFAAAPAEIVLSY